MSKIKYIVEYDGKFYDFKEDRIISKEEALDNIDHVRFENKSNWQNYTNEDLTNFNVFDYMKDVEANQQQRKELLKIHILKRLNHIMNYAKYLEIALNEENFSDNLNVYACLDQIAISLHLMKDVLKEIEDITNYESSLLIHNYKDEQEASTNYEKWVNEILNPNEFEEPFITKRFKEGLKKIVSGATDND